MACQAHGGGFAGTIQAFVAMLSDYITAIELVFGEVNRHKIFIRAKGSVKVEL